MAARSSLALEASLFPKLSNVLQMGLVMHEDSVKRNDPYDTLINDQLFY